MKDIARELLKVARELVAGTRWEVQEDNLIGGWKNNWHEDDKPLTFKSKSEAQRELKEFLDDIKGEVARGNIDEEYDPDNYRIVPVQDSSKKIIKFLDNAISNLKLWIDIEPGGKIQDTYLYRTHAWFNDAIELMEDTGEDERNEEQFKALKQMSWYTMPRSGSSPITFAGMKVTVSEFGKGSSDDVLDDPAAVGKFQRKIKRFIGEINKLKRSL